MKDQNIQAIKEAYCRFYDRIQSLIYESWNRWYTHYIFIEEECKKQHYQDYIGISTHNSTRVTQRVEGSNYISWIRI